MRSIQRALRVAEILVVVGAAGACGSSAGSASSAGQKGWGDAAVVGDDASSWGDGGSATCVNGCGADDASVDAATPVEGGGAFDGDPGGVFVATTGSDAAPGTMAKPVATIAKGIALAQTAHKDLYVCSGTYAENVTIATTAVSAHGGYDCTHAWSRVDDRPILAPSSGVPLTVRGVSAPMKLERLQLEAPDATADGDSSIAALAANVASLTLSEVVLQAGAGAQGAAGQSPSQSATPAPGGNAGGSISSIMCPEGTTGGYCGQILRGGSAPTIVWGSCENPGGAGGDGANVNVNYPGSAPAAGIGGGQAGTLGNAGGNGAPGSDGSSGAASAVDVGTFTATGYLPSNGGTAGTKGGAGAGGGGGCGGSSKVDDPSGGINSCPFTTVGAGGGAGGWGGCGGAAGGGGGGGGASLGLLAVSSQVSLVHCEVSTGSGGVGGSAGKGAEGQPGGAAGTGGIGTHGGGKPEPYCSQAANNGSDGASGGAGGRGGQGGPGGPGAGGPSIGIVVVGGTQPDTSTVDFNVGAGGTGASSLTGQTNAADGKSTQVLVIGAPDGGAIDASAD